jgi:hypothetical protein
MPQVEIRVQGQIGRQWSEWLEALEIRHNGQGETVLTVSPVDQAALYGLLAKLRNLGLTLVSLNPVADGDSAGRARGSDAR